MLEKEPKELSQIREELLPGLLSKNDFDENSPYDQSNPKFFTPEGKEPEGSAIDIATRKTNVVKNRYNEAKRYTGPTILP